MVLFFGINTLDFIIYFHNVKYVKPHRKHAYVNRYQTTVKQKKIL
jgi:hypothetical protein